MTAAAPAKIKPVTFESSALQWQKIAMTPGSEPGENAEYVNSPEEGMERHEIHFKDGKYIATSQDEIDLLTRLPDTFAVDGKAMTCRGCKKLWGSRDAWQNCEESHAPVRPTE